MDVEAVSRQLSSSTKMTSQPRTPQAKLFERWYFLTSNAMTNHMPNFQKRHKRIAGYDFFNGIDRKYDIKY